MLRNARHGHRCWPALAFAVLVCPVVVRAGEPVVQDRVTYLMNTLLYAHDHDDREDAAEDLGKIGDPRAIPALEQAAAYDEKGDVRKEAHKALKRINAYRPVAVAAPAAAPVVTQPAPAAAPPPPPPAPPPVAVPAPVVVAPPPPVYVIPAPVVVRHYYYPAPVVVPAPVPVYGPSFGFSFGYFHHSHHH